MAECRRCLLYQINKEAFASIYEYIESIDRSLRTPELEYRRRLEHCMSCEELHNGMCGLCGCFVEVRAAKAHNRCSMTKSKW